MSERAALLVFWSDPAVYPAVVSTSQLLSEHGVQVTILSRGPGTFDITAETEFGALSRVIQVGVGRNGWRDKLAFAQFIARAVGIVIRTRPAVVITYNLLGGAVGYVIQMLSPATRLVYHNFDIAPPESLGVLGRLLQHGEFRAARRADRVLLSSPGRAVAFQRDAALSDAPISVYNCQRLDKPLKHADELRRFLAECGYEFDRVVLNVGTMGPKHGLEAAVASLASWKGNWGLVLAGVPEGSFDERLTELAARHGVADRLVLLRSVNVSMWNSCLAAADVGIALYEPANINHTYMAGASSKMGSYLKVGLPLVVPPIPDFLAFLDTYDCGRPADPHDANDIAAAVNGILADDGTYRHYQEEARRAFLEEYNFETQIQPLWEWFQSALGVPPLRTSPAGRQP